MTNSIGSAALAQRALAEAYRFGRQRTAFGRPILAQPLLRDQFDRHVARVQRAFALAWEAVLHLDAVWQQTPRYSGTYHLFRLIAHLAKYWTADVAVQTAMWSMVAHGGAGVLADYPVERLLREAMILPIWEGTPQRQVLDGLEVMDRREAHHLQADKEAQADALFTALAEVTADAALRRLARLRSPATRPPVPDGAPEPRDRPAGRGAVR